MHLYTYVSIMAVLIATIILYIIFRQNNLKDCRYHIGLLASAVIALIASLFLPKIVSVISVDWALQFVLAFFIALLAYITLIFLVMMLVAAVFPKEKSDKMVEKWEKWKTSKEEKKIEKKNKRDKKAESGQVDADDSKQQHEPVLKNIFIRKFSLKKEKDTSETEKPEENNLPEIPDEKASSEYIPESFKPMEDEKAGSEYIPESFKPMEDEKADSEYIPESFKPMEDEKTDSEYVPDNFESLGDEPKSLTDKADEGIFIDEVQGIQPEDSYETVDEMEPETTLYEELQVEGKKEADYEQKFPDGADNSDQFENFQEFFAELGENTEKNVDTSDIIDKMGIDTIPDSTELSSGQLSIDEVLDQAFLLKQEGRELEAASLYINALNMKPDTEVTFWIVLDICVIYRNFGQSELAADILKAYINEYDDLMSNDVKEQILQSLYF